MSDQETFKIGQRVCIVGRGTANMVHVHAQIVRVTKTMYVAGYEARGHQIERRYRKGYTGREVGASHYGGSSMSSACQRLRKS